MDSHQHVDSKIHADQAQVESMEALNQAQPVEDEKEVSGGKEVAVMQGSFVEPGQNTNQNIPAVFVPTSPSSISSDGEFNESGVGDLNAENFAVGVVEQANATENVGTQNKTPTGKKSSTGRPKSTKNACSPGMLYERSLQKMAEKEKKKKELLESQRPSFKPVLVTAGGSRKNDTGLSSSRVGHGSRVPAWDRLYEEGKRTRRNIGTKEDSHVQNASKKNNSVKIWRESEGGREPAWDRLYEKGKQSLRNVSAREIAPRRGSETSKSMRTGKGENPAWERLYAKGKEERRNIPRDQEAAAILKRRMEDKELQKCTFKPEINDEKKPCGSVRVVSPVQKGSAETGSGTFTAGTMEVTTMDSPSGTTEGSRREPIAEPFAVMDDPHITTGAAEEGNPFDSLADANSLDGDEFPFEDEVGLNDTNREQKVEADIVDATVEEGPKEEVVIERVSNSILSAAHVSASESEVTEVPTFTSPAIRSQATKEDTVGEVGNGVTNVTMTTTATMLDSPASTSHTSVSENENAAAMPALRVAYMSDVPLSLPIREEVQCLGVEAIMMPDESDA